MGGVVVEDKVSFEEAINKTGFGLYSYLLLSLAGLAIISMVCTMFGNTIIIPTSACELQTTNAQRGILAAIPSIGFIFGAVFWGYLADVHGRRLTWIICLISAATVNALASVSVNWIMLMILQFIATFFSSGQYSISMTILSESIPMAKRNVVVLLVGSIYQLSQGIMAALAIPIIPLAFSYELPTLGIYWNSWRTLLLVYSAPGIICAVWVFFMYESPKYLFSKGRETEAAYVLKKIHGLNNLGSRKELNIKGIVIETSGQKLAKTQILTLFKSPLLKNTTILTALFVFQQLSSLSTFNTIMLFYIAMSSIMTSTTVARQPPNLVFQFRPFNNIIGAFAIWLPTIANQFVEILDTGEGSNLTLCEIIRSNRNVSPDPDTVPCSLNMTSLLIVVAVGTMKSISNALVSLVVNRVGRRNMVMIVTALCGVSGVVVNLIPNAIASAAMFFIFLIGIITIGLYTAMSVALFPTHLRALALSFTLTGGRVASFASVQILNALLANNCEAGFYFYSALFASSAIVAAFLADDRFSQIVKENTTL